MRNQALYVATFAVAIGYGISFPLIAISLRDFGAGAAMIGLVSAMPALGWLLASPVLPRLQARFPLSRIQAVVLVVALAALAGLRALPDPGAWLALRLFFGGAMGVFFRLVEYALNARNRDAVRGRVFGIYSVMFSLGLALGSMGQPELGTGTAAYIAVAGFVLLGLVSTPWLGGRETAQTPTAGPRWHGGLRPALIALPGAMVFALAYGLFEELPANLYAVLALDAGMGREVSAYTLTAFVLGAMLFSVPIGWLSDRIGRLVVLRLATALALVLVGAMALSLTSPRLFLGVLFVQGGVAGAIYNTALAWVGDRFQGPELASANAAFGMVYAAASVAGPILGGLSMEAWRPLGLLLYAAVVLGLGLALGGWRKPGAR